MDLTAPDGVVSTVRALGVDSGTGALVIQDPDAPTGERLVLVGEVVRVRLATAAATSASATAEV